MSDLDTPATRFSQHPRPLDFVRARLYRGGQAEYIRDLLEDEKATLFDDLAALRTEGKPEDDPDVQEVRANLRHLINFLADVNRGLIELVGPDVP